MQMVQDGTVQKLNIWKKKRHAFDSLPAVYAHGSPLCLLAPRRICLNAVKSKKPGATAGKTVWLQLL